MAVLELLTIFTTAIGLGAAFVWLVHFEKSSVKYLSSIIAAAALIQSMDFVPQLYSLIFFVICISILKLLDASIELKKQKPNDLTSDLSETIGTYRFNYMNNDGGMSNRVVDVKKIWSTGSQTYFSGYCRQAKELRTFKLDQVFGEVVDLNTGEFIKI